MLQEINNKVLFYASCLLAAYFGFLILDAYFLKLSFVLIGVFRELLTIPAVFLLPVLFVFVVIRWWKEKFQFNGYAFWSIVILAITCTAMVLATVFEDALIAVK